MNVDAKLQQSSDSLELYSESFETLETVSQTYNNTLLEASEAKIETDSKQLEANAAWNSSLDVHKQWMDAIDAIEIERDLRFDMCLSEIAEQNSSSSSSRRLRLHVPRKLQVDDPCDCTPEELEVATLETEKQTVENKIGTAKNQLSTLEQWVPDAEESVEQTWEKYDKAKDDVTKAELAEQLAQQNVDFHQKLCDMAEKALKTALVHMGVAEAAYLIALGSPSFYDDVITGIHVGYTIYKVNEATDSFNKAIDDLTEAEKNFDKKKKETEDAKGERDDKKGEWEDAKKALKDLEKEISDLINEIKDLIKQLEKIVIDLKAAREALKECVRIKAQSDCPPPTPPGGCDGKLFCMQSDRISSFFS